MRAPSRRLLLLLLVFKGLLAGGEQLAVRRVVADLRLGERVRGRVTVGRLCLDDVDLRGRSSTRGALNVVGRGVRGLLRG